LSRYQAHYAICPLAIDCGSQNNVFRNHQQMPQMVIWVFVMQLHDTEHNFLVVYALGLFQGLRGKSYNHLRSLPQQ
jgi:hypothetical protein